MRCFQKIIALVLKDADPLALSAREHFEIFWDVLKPALFCLLFGNAFVAVLYLIFYLCGLVGGVR